jgi:hypothetical protein
MNSAHDLGGMHGFGPIEPEPENEEPVFHSDWGKRVFGLTLAAGFLGKWNIDMSRYARERQHPVDYLMKYTRLSIDDLPSLPRDQDGPVFNQPWEAKAFALALCLSETGCFLNCEPHREKSAPHQ